MVEFVMAEMTTLVCVFFASLALFKIERERERECGGGKNKDEDANCG